VSETADFIDAIVGPWREFATLIETDMEFGPEPVRTEGLRFLTRHLVAGLSMTLEADPAYPQFVRFADPTLSWGINNPDGNYAFLALDGSGTYRVSGDLGTAEHLDFQVHAPSFTEAPDYRIVGARKRPDLVVGPDGGFEMVLSAQPQPGNWLELTPDAESLIFRQFFGSWDGQRPARVAVERVDAPYPPPPLSAEFLADRLARLQRWCAKAGVYWHRMCKMSFDAGDNNLVFQPPSFSEWGGHQGQSYGFGNFRLEPGEAVIVEIDPPTNEYWGVQLGNRFWESLDWDRRQSSLNGSQARLDADGHFRGVIALQDPGVANWLDPAGNRWGSIMGRFIQPEQTPVATCTVVPLAGLFEHLPAGTARVSPAERGVALRRRSIAAQLRQGY
jgi:hypothetical protein